LDDAIKVTIESLGHLWPSEAGIVQGEDPKRRLRQGFNVITDDRVVLGESNPSLDVSPKDPVIVGYPLILTVGIHVDHREHFVPPLTDRIGNEIPAEAAVEEERWLRTLRPPAASARGH
jgi:hypothetical protein